MCGWAKDNQSVNVRILLRKIEQMLVGTVLEGVVATAEWWLGSLSLQSMC